MGLGYEKNKKGFMASTSTSNNFNEKPNFIKDILEEEAIILSYDDFNVSTIFNSTSIFTISLSLHHPNLIDWDLQGRAPLYVLSYEHLNYKNKKKQSRNTPSSENLYEVLLDSSKLKKRVYLLVKTTMRHYRMGMFIFLL